MTILNEKEKEFFKEIDFIDLLESSLDSAIQNINLSKPLVLEESFQLILDFDKPKQILIKLENLNKNQNELIKEQWKCVISLLILSKYNYSSKESQIILDNYIYLLNAIKVNDEINNLIKEIENLEVIK